MSRTILTTERLTLHEITPEDFADLFAIWSGAEAMKFFPRTLDEQALHEWIQRTQQRYEKDGHGLWAVILQSEEKLIGDCGLMLQDINGIEELEVGYHFNKNYWGKGYATEAAHACMEYAFQQLQRCRIIAPKICPRAA